MYALLLFLSHPLHAATAFSSPHLIQCWSNDRMDYHTRHCAPTLKKEKKKKRSTRLHFMLISFACWRLFFASKSAIFLWSCSVVLCKFFLSIVSPSPLTFNLFAFHFHVFCFTFFAFFFSFFLLFLQLKSIFLRLYFYIFEFQSDSFPIERKVRTFALRLNWLSLRGRWSAVFKNTNHHCQGNLNNC